MKVALPVWDKRLSPVLDFAHRLLVAKIQNRAVMQRWYHPINPQLSIFSQAAVLSHLGIEVLICGSLSSDLSDMIQSFGIQIIPGLTGDVEEILHAFLNNRLAEPRFRLPGANAGSRRFQ